MFVVQNLNLNKLLIVGRRLENKEEFWGLVKLLLFEFFYLIYLAQIFSSSFQFVMNFEDFRFEAFNSKLLWAFRYSLKFDFVFLSKHVKDISGWVVNLSTEARNLENYDWMSASEKLSD